MWFMPQVGADTRCDHAEGCPKRTSNCQDLYGKNGGETCEVFCAGDPGGSKHGVETLQCTGDNQWTTVGKVLQCPEARRPARPGNHGLPVPGLAPKYDPCNSKSE